MNQLYENFTDEQKKQIEVWTDLLYRPMIKTVASMGSNVFQPTLDGYLASPTGAISTVQSPAPDSVAGLLSLLAPTEFIPLTISGLAGAQPIPAAAITPDMMAIFSLLTNYYTDQLRQYRTQVVGPINIMGA